MTRTNGTIGRVILVCWAVHAIAATIASADTITLRRSVRIEHAGPITLAHIADLEGTRAERLAETYIADRVEDLPTIRDASHKVGHRRYRLDLDTVRSILKKTPGTNWAFITLRGGDIVVQGSRNGVQAGTGSEDATRAPRNRSAPAMLSEVPEGSIGAHARRVVRTILQVEDADLRIAWPVRQAETLLEPVDGRTVHVQPIGSSKRMPLSIRIYDGDRLVRSETLRAEIRVRRTVRTASRALPRGTRLGPDDFTTSEAWVGPGLSPADEAVGQITSRRLEPGTMIETTDIEPPLVIERGEQISLHCVAGSVAIRLPARALGNAREGEILEVEMAGTGKRVMARAGSAGNAVLLVGAIPSTPERNRSDPASIAVGSNTEIGGR